MMNPCAARLLRCWIRALAGDASDDDALAFNAPLGDTPADASRASESHAARHQTTDSDPHALGDVTLLPHQRAGARRLRSIIERHGGALLADEVGLGKTFTALHVARDARRVLIVAPASLRAMWEDACHRTRISATITSYERVSAGSHPRDGRWELVILDEAHHARSPATRRYATLCDLTRSAHVLLLTATPIHNRLADLQSLFALFLGAGAERLDGIALSALVVRRRERDLDQSLPALDALLRHPVPHAEGVLPAIRALPPPLPPADGGLAHALVRLQLARAWCSSDAALLAAIRNRLSTATALEHALAAGRLPSRRDLSAWSAGSDGSVQLAFAELVTTPAAGAECTTPLSIVREHAESLRRLRALVRGAAARDHARMATLVRVLDARAGRQAIVFTHSTATAELAFRTLRDTHRVALLTGRGACIASGPVPRADVLRQFAPDAPPSPRAATSRSKVGHRESAASSSALPPLAEQLDQRTVGIARPDESMRIDILVASDVVSEGVDLQRAGVVVHLDLPWTVARLEQRIGRVRRLGSSHAAVASHLITPPVDAEELQLTLAHLSRKATLAGKLVGPSSILGDSRVWGGILPDTPAIAPATVRRSIIEALRVLESRAQSRSECEPPAACESVETSHACTSSVAASCAPRGRAPPPLLRWRAIGSCAPLVIALIALDGEPHLVCARDDEVLLDPAAVLAALGAAIDDLRPGDTARSGAPAPIVDGRRKRSTEPPPHELHARDSQHLESRVREWCAERAAAGLLSLPDACNSPSHRRLLHAIDRVAARAPRTRRAHVVAAAARARSLVGAQRGAGSERLLSALADSAPPPRSSIDDLLAWLARIETALHTTLARLSTIESIPADERGVALLGMLALLPAEEGG